MENLDNLEDLENISDIEIKEQPKTTKKTYNLKEIIPEEVKKGKKPLTEKQKENWEKCKLAREQKRKERKELLDAYNKKLEEEMELKILKKAQAIQNKKVKENTKKIIYEDLKEYREETEAIEPKKNVKACQSVKPQEKPAPPAYRRFVWC